MSPRSFISLGFEGGISCARFNVQIPSVSHKLVRANAFFLFLILFYFIFFLCVNKENDTDQNALASIKLLIVVQRMAILFFWGETKGNLCQSFYTPDIKS